ncbi:MAG: ATP-binding protein, partial [Dehalococcoidia bacterium]|nr:ATP-binding protein [Dehalococcoidia bacterium]
MPKLTRLTSGTAPFRPRARLIRLLGDELISDEVMAVVELVKNAYDADAREVLVGLYALNDPETARLEVRDDGEGMDLDTVLHAWLEPATDRKRRGGRKRRTALGRYPLGEKGVGRFAADKLGSEMELVTRGRGADREIRLHIRWDLFGAGGYLDEVENRWEVRRPLTFGEGTHGTLVRVTRPRARWDGARVARVRDGLSRLVSPFSQMRDFRVVLDCPDFPDQAGPVTNRLLDHAPYRLIGEVDAAGLLRAETPSGEVIDLRHFAPERFLNGGQLRLPECGPFRVALFVWDLDSVGLRRAAVDRAMRQALKRSCGVSIYRDGFRIWPYGAPGDDWLELNQRRVNNPTMRVSTNQIIGIVEITQERNPDLRDRTSREGLIDTPVLHDLKALLLGVLARLEEHRFAARQDVVALPPEPTESDAVLGMVHQLRVRSQAGEATSQLLDRIAAAYREQMKVHETRQEQLMRLAGIGLAAEQLGAEINRTVAAASTALRIARNAAGWGAVPDEVTRSLEQLEGHIWLLGEQLDAMEPLYSASAPLGEEPVDVRSVVNHAATVFTYRLRQADVRLVLEARTPVTIRMI